MPGFHIVFRNEIMIINFGELQRSTVLKLCTFMKVSNFPRLFFDEKMVDSYYDLVMEFYSTEEVVVKIDGEECYHGDDFDDVWNNYEYYNFFNDVIFELRQERDEEDEEILDELNELNRDVDYLDLYNDYLTAQEEDDNRVEENNRMVDDDIKTINL
jgi:hypothetical protein